MSRNPLNKELLRRRPLQSSMFYVVWRSFTLPRKSPCPGALRMYRSLNLYASVLLSLKTAFRSNAGGIPRRLAKTLHRLLRTSGGPCRPPILFAQKCKRRALVLCSLDRVRGAIRFKQHPAIGQRHLFIPIQPPGGGSRTGVLDESNKLRTIDQRPSGLPDSQLCGSR